MKDLSQLTAGFSDHGGLYLPLAQKLAETYKRVIYFDQCEKAFPKIGEIIIGDGFEKIDRVDGFWSLKQEIDLFIFPDSQGAALQLELASQGFPVWGSRTSETLEQSREKFHRVLGEVGLQVPQFERVVGLSALREYLNDRTDKYIKISKYRGDMETFHWRSMDDDAPILDAWAVKFGGVREMIPFLVFEKIDTELEIGGDTYFSGGRWPNAMLDGFEHKDRGFFGAFKPYEEMPEQTRAVMEAFGPILKQHGHSNFWSMEIRVMEDGSFYFIDVTPRGPLPAIGSEMEIYSNLAEIVAAGADGESVNPEPAGKFAAECALTQKGNKHEWSSVKVPDSLKQWMKLGGSCMIGDRIWFPSDDSNDHEIGWLVAIGDTPTETIETMLKQAEDLPDGIEAQTDSLIELLKEVHKSEEQGIEFSQQIVPEPEAVVIG